MRVYGTLRAYDSRFSENATYTGSGGVQSSGGGIFVRVDAVAVIERGSVVANQTGRGGGIYNAGYLELRDTTAADNQTNGAGAGIYNVGIAVLNHVTVAVNSGSGSDGPRAAGGGGLYTAGEGATSIVYTIVSQNDAVADPAEQDCLTESTGVLLSLGGNLVDENSEECRITGATERDVCGESALLRLDLVRGAHPPLA